eukprot:6465002-Amphidinium_carterae.1
MSDGYEPTLLADSDMEEEVPKPEAERPLPREDVDHAQGRWSSSSREGTVELRRLLLDAEVEAAKRPKLKSWWERGFLSKIFGSPSASGLPTPMYDESMWAPSQAAADGANVEATGTLFSRGGREHHTRSWNQIKDERREKEMSAWLPFLLAVPQATELGRHLQERRLKGEGDVTLRQVLLSMLSSRDPLTLSQHRRTLAKWSEHTGKPGVPMSIETLERYMAHLHDSGASGSASVQLYRTALFAEHVLGAAVKEVAKNKTVLGYLSAARGRVKGRSKRRPLTTAEVCALECLVLDDDAVLVNRVIAGAFLFTLLARARWSELSACLTLSTDKLEADGFIEVEVASVKTAAQHLRGKSSFVMVACLQGLSSEPWGVTWMTLRERAGLHVDSGGSPLVPAPAEGGGFTQLAMNSRMATSWLHELLGKQGDHDLSTHSLKTTVLFWANAGGLLMEQRRQLGYHRTRETRVTELYGRDLVAAGARSLACLVGAIRSGCLCPDAARSARFPKGLKALRMALEFGEQGEEESHTLPVESTSSKAHRGSEPGEEESHAQPVESTGSQAHRRSEPSSSDSSVDASEPCSDTELRRHMRYGTVHKLQGVGTATFICGRQCVAGGNYEPVDLADLISAKCCMKCFP